MNVQSLLRGRINFIISICGPPVPFMGAYQLHLFVWAFSHVRGRTYFIFFNVDKLTEAVLLVVTDAGILFRQMLMNNFFDMPQFIAIIDSLGFNEVSYCSSVSHFTPKFYWFCSGFINILCSFSLNVCAIVELVTWSSNFLSQGKN